MESGILTKGDIDSCMERLKSFFPSFLDIANDEIKSYDVSGEVLQYYSYAIQYNLQGGKMLRGTLVAATVKTLAGDNMTETLWLQTLTLAWCVELLQTSFLVADDMMDQSTTRRSNACWYLVPTIGIKNAINDTMFLYTLINRIIINNLKDHPNLLEIIDTFGRVSMTTILGQHMDTYDSQDKSLLDSGEVATKLFNRICKNKTSYYTFFLPVKFGMILSGMDSSNLCYSRVESISVLLGLLFQAQDDFLDCYGNPEHCGKDGTDIQTRKCSWLLAKALSIGSQDQIRRIKENIGKCDEDKVQIVKDVFDELEMQSLFAQYSGELTEKIEDEINQLDHRGIKSILQWSLHIITKRSK
ncbi:farnesyl pyrophosphate synthetase, putative [Theileria equi strain WA]|uniref:Farnesyl pyrophosphate synthetase, putative n=1 Tax=Theileria equi strain WA TaxID=1537102 RepID=L1LGN4_THEEQ|nr:farnesyl pyrophosphate synthetase, putative [Theileria equi strain WA]EKX74420.1 farnesyl pyrophosphate synthetase, putative [Theileria equi strain WA]|eukprot:XP_004833872.1 farnesyl pyrophosphate synthetase, putative [Theileria equi strain WA]